MAKDRHSRTEQICGPDCTYRDLYAGAQATLTEMAASQARALATAARLRENVINALRASMPRSFRDLEAQIKVRVADVDDDTLLTCVTYLIDQAVAGGIDQGNWPGREALRVALTDLGIDASHDDPVEWADAVSRWAAAQRAAATAAVLPQMQRNPRTGRSLAEAAAELERSRGRSLAAVAAMRGDLGRTPTTAAEPAPASGPTTAPGSWMHPEPLVPVAAEPVTSPPPAASPEPEAAPAPVASPEPAESPAPAATAPDPALAPVASPAPVSSPEPDSRDELGGPWDTDEPGDWLNEDLDGGDTPGELADETFLDNVDDDGWDDEFLDWAPPGQGTLVESDDPEPEPQTSPAPAPAAKPEPTAPMALGPAPTPASAPTPVTAAAGPAANTPAQAGQDGPVVKAQFRPDLFGGGNLSKPPARKKRSPRVRATPPTADLDVPANVVSGELDQSTRAALDAAVAIPRPVFIADLIETFGDDAVENWQEEHRRDGSVVRFLPAKARHRARGSLVVPVSHLRNAAGEFGRGVWAECMQVHTGARLFELGVVLHAFQDQVVTHQVHTHGNTVQLVVRQPRGACGAVVLCAGDISEGSAAADALLGDVEALAAQPMSLIVVSSTSDPVFDDMCRLITDAAAARRWRLPCPIVGARSWEWASGNQAALRHLAG